MLITEKKVDVLVVLLEVIYGLKIIFIRFMHMGDVVGHINNENDNEVSFYRI